MKTHERTARPAVRTHRSGVVRFQNYCKEQISPNPATLQQNDPKVQTQEDPSKPLIRLHMHAVHTHVMHMENRDARGMVTRDNVLVQATDTGKRDRPCRWNRDARLRSDAKKKTANDGTRPASMRRSRSLLILRSAERHSGQPSGQSLQAGRRTPPLPENQAHQAV